MTGFSLVVRRLVKERAGLADNGWVRCERCGVWNEYVQLHHRRPRQRGGSKDPATNLPSNSLSLCMADHAWTEEHRTAAMAEGLLLRSWDDPTKVPVTLWDGRYLLDNDGGRTEFPEAA